jgi:catechol 2,3-dioxygenase-like lactoylglutathione lyase family enzyme
MLDHVFLPVSDVPRSVRFYEQGLAPLGFTARVDYDGKNGPPGHPDLKGFGKAACFSGSERRASPAIRFTSASSPRLVTK